MTNSLYFTICLLLLIPLLLIKGCAINQGPPASTENLLAAPPEDWNQIYQINNVTTRLTDFVPPDQTAMDWDTKLSFESFRKLADADPIEVLMNEAEKDKEKCRFVQHFNLFSGFENDYPTSMRLIMCGENDRVEMGEIEMIKAIQGNDYLYVVRMLKRIPPFEVNQPEIAREEMAKWASYFKAISLCDPAREDHPCPDEPDQQP